eukprot:CAMPEP_0170590250 /NCGR_PEP_ID=MMETSP0224-20130122/11770_1 /TAXON_ID=285029 /ORGANISM="Togula jolla, Strain CCCM 725" /LENGTH=200 /DNA_ID=CAMNT_0010914035 /DNA_START=106 /DNA_END=708 /DNA_ORIENTATION=+
MADLVEPSKPQNSYWLWLTDNRAALTKEAGSSKGPVVSKLAGEKWKALSAAAKAPFEKKAASLKAEYEEAMEKFVADGGVKGKRRAEKADSKKAMADKKARKEAKKASGAPSKPQNAYWLWLADNRAAITKEAGSAVGPVVSKLAGEKWKALSAEKKVPYEEKAAALKAEYVKAMEEFKKAPAGEVGGDDEEEADGDVEA